MTTAPTSTAIPFNGWPSVRPYSPLSMLLVSAPLLAVLALPLGCWQNPRFLVAVAALAGMAFWMVYRPALPLMRHYRSRPVWSHLILQWWCACGVGLLPGALVTQVLVSDLPLPARALLITSLIVLWLMVTLPLPLLYRPHLTALDDAAVTAITTRDDLEIAGAHGVRLHARMYRPRQRAALGLVVFTHGMGGWKEGFLNHLRVFSEAGWCVLSYDLRGCGRSSASAVTYGAFETSDLVAVWTAARRIAGDLPMVAAGASMGASVTVLAGMQLAGCRGYIIESPFADLNTDLHRLLPGPLAAIARALTRIGIGFDPDCLRPISSLLLHSRAPMLFGWISDDRTIPAAESAAVAAVATHARTVVMEHGEHLDLIVHEPWWRAVHAFLADAAAAVLPGQDAPRSTRSDLFAGQDGGPS